MTSHDRSNDVYRIAVTTLALSLLMGCANTTFRDEQLQPGYKSPHHNLPIMEIKALKESQAATIDRTRPIWIDPQPMPKLAQTAAEILKRHGYTVSTIRGEGVQALAFDGHYRVMGAGLRTPRQLSLAELANQVDITLVTDTGTRGLGRAALNYASGAGWSGAANTPGQMLVAGLLGAGIEGVLGLLVPEKEKPQSPIQDYRQRTLVRGKDVPLVCGGTEAECDKSLLGARYGNQQLMLALDRLDRDGRHRAVVRVDAIAEDLMPDRMMTEAANRLLAMYITP